MHDSGDKPKPTIITTSLPKTDKRRTFQNISGDSDGILTKLFHTVCYDLTDGKHFSFMAWRRLMDKYLDEVARHDPEVNRQNERGNFTKALLAPKMSWKTFIKALRFLRFTKVRIIIEGHREDGSCTVHSTTVSFANKNGDDDTNIDIIEESAKEGKREREKGNGDSDEGKI